MSETDFRKDTRSSTQGLGDKLQQAGEDAKQRASEAFDATSDVAREKLDELGAAARETASHAAEKMKEQVSAQRAAGADYAQHFAENIRSAAKAFEHDTPIAARTIEMAAGFIDDAAEKMRHGSMNDAMEGITSFARRQPAAFLGLSVLTGFAVVRFLKATGSGTGSAGPHSYSGSQAGVRSNPHGEFRSTGARRSS
jgi:hypothetical protein